MQTPNSTSNSNSHGLNRTIKRLFNEFKELSNHPPDNILVKFNEDLILEWHFLFIGLKDTPFDGGEYHGVIVFPENYPFSPPSIRFITPNGRFKTDERLCFSVSDFHPECWKPAYTVSAVLKGVYSFMMSETSDIVGNLNMEKAGIQSLARKSREFNETNKVYKKLFKKKIHEVIKHPPNYSHTQAKGKEITVESADLQQKKSEIIECFPENCGRGIQSTEYALNCPILKENRIKPTHLNQVSTPDMTIKAKQKSNFEEIKQTARTSIDDSKNRLPKGNISESSRGNQRMEYTLNNTEKKNLDRFPEKQGIVIDSIREHSSERSSPKQLNSTNKATRDSAFNLTQSNGSDNTPIPSSQSLSEAKDFNLPREMNPLAYNILQNGYYQIPPFNTPYYYITCTYPPFYNPYVFLPYPPIFSNNSRLSQSFYIDRPINYPPSYHGNQTPLDISNISLNAGNFRGTNRTDLIESNFPSSTDSSASNNSLKRYPTAKNVH